MSPPYDASSHSTTPPNIFYDSPNPCGTPYSVTNGPPLGFNPISRLLPPSPSITTAMTSVSSAPGISEWLANIPAGTSQCTSSTGVSSNPPASNLPVHPKLSKPVPAHADFSINDLDQLLCAVIVSMLSIETSFLFFCGFPSSTLYLFAWLQMILSFILRQLFMKSITTLCFLRNRVPNITS